MLGRDARPDESVNDNRNSLLLSFVSHDDDDDDDGVMFHLNEPPRTRIARIGRDNKNQYETHTHKRRRGTKKDVVNARRNESNSLTRNAWVQYATVQILTSNIHGLTLKNIDF